jgi:hypothetical protein
MKRTLIAVAALVGLASAANAATLSISGGGTFNVGDTITLTITGDSQGESALNATGFLDSDNSAVTAGLTTATQSQTTLLFLGSIPWTAGALNFCTAAQCKAFDQLSALGVNPASAANLLTATISFLATAPGTAHLSWDQNVAGGTSLQFFSLTNAAGTTITVNAVPEPTTAALLGLGLFGLAVAGRRR